MNDSRPHNHRGERLENGLRAREKGGLGGWWQETVKCGREDRQRSLVYSTSHTGWLGNLKQGPEALEDSVSLITKEGRHRTDSPPSAVRRLKRGSG